MAMVKLWNTLRVYLPGWITGMDQNFAEVQQIALLPSMRSGRGGGPCPSIGCGTHIHAFRANVSCLILVS